MMMSKSLPYDAEIEYLEGDGNSYIDTNLLPTTDNWQLETQIKTSGSTGNYGICSEVENDGDNQLRRFALLWEYSGIFRCTKCKGTYNDNKTAIFSNVLRNTIYTIKSNINIGNVRITVNGGNPNFKNDSDNYNFTTRTLTLFARRNVNVIDAFFKGRIYYAKLSKNDILVRDFIPVRVGNVGYMYDKVSGQLFGNQGTGNFVLGPDKA